MDSILDIHTRPIFHSIDVAYGERRLCGDGDELMGCM